MLRFFVRDQYQHEQLHEDVNSQEEERRLRRENVYRNDTLEQYQFYGSMANDEMRPMLIVEGNLLALYNQLNFEYEDEFEESNR